MAKMIQYAMHKEPIWFASTVIGMMGVGILFIGPKFVHSEIVEGGLASLVEKEFAEYEKSTNPNTENKTAKSVSEVITETVSVKNTLGLTRNVGERPLRN